MSTHDRAGSPSDDLAAWGIEGGYHDGLGTWREPAPEAAALLRRAMGATTDDPTERPPAGAPLSVLRPGDPFTLEEGTTLVLEDGTRLEGLAALPPDLPYGYHLLEAAGPGDDPARHHLILSPGRCHLPEELHVWGLTLQLYAARSRSSWGIGDLADLRRVLDWARSRGAGIVGLNPLHAPTPVERPPNSPYSPSSRRWRNPLYLAVEDVPGASSLDEMDALVAAGRLLAGADLIDRTAVWALKRRALEALWDRFPGATAFERYRAAEGDDLETWATFCALADHHGSGWRSWPVEHRRPDSPAVARFAADHPHRIGFWAWLQWLLDEQLSASGAGEVAMGDLAIGFDADGADAWQWQDLLAEGVRIGAPPDPLGRDGQDWGLPPFVPWKLRDAAYAPLAATLRANLRHSRGLRIDHVMGLFRLFWIPPGYGAVDGAYVRHRGRELLDVLALESHRAGALVVGEDLGTVEAGTRERLAGAGVLSTRLLWFEDGSPETWPRQAMAAITTHDLPTVAGVWTGTDLADQQRAGVTVAPDGDDDLRHRLRASAGVADGAPADQVVLGAHRRLAGSPSMVVTAAVDDLLGAVHRPNLPGTVDEHPNWRIPLPVAVDDLPGHPLAEAVAEALRAGGR